MSSRKRKQRAAESQPEESQPLTAAEPLVSEIKELRPKDAPLTAQDAMAELADAEPEPEEPEAAEAAVPSVPTTRAQMKRALESLIFVSDNVVTAQQLARLVKAKLADVRELVAELTEDYQGRGIELVEVSGGYQFRSAAASAPFVQNLIAQKPTRLSRSQLETLALIAYRQPITRPEIDDVRGVDSGSALKMLLERDLVKILGRKDEAGRPLLYGTTPYFLEFFQMNTMQDLPTLREFTELSSEHRDLFQKKTGEVPDLSVEAEAQAQAEVVPEAEPVEPDESAEPLAEPVEESLDADSDAQAAAPPAAAAQGEAYDDEDFEPWPDDEPEAPKEDSDSRA